MNTRSVALLLGMLIPVSGYAAQETVTCREQTTQGHTAKLCLHDPGMFRHYQFSLSVDGEQIFSLVDDYAETFSLTHKMPEGPSIEFPLSKQDMNPITLSGGCKPVLSAAGDAEIGRVCDIKWGKVDIIKDAKFSFE